MQEENMVLTAKSYLEANLKRDANNQFGVDNDIWLKGVVDAWMDDKSNSKHRFDIIKTFLPKASKILDLASGCGTAFFYGFLNGYEMHGIEPEVWKHNFMAMKSAEYNYPESWLSNNVIGIGENLPYPDQYFDCVTSYQTLEHVQDVNKVICEMLRVTKIGGGVHIQCPDYKGTFEGHYLMPWLPLFPRSLANLYLRILGKPTMGLTTIQYVTRSSILKCLNQWQQDNPERKYEYVDINFYVFRSSKKTKFIPRDLIKPAFYFYRLYLYVVQAFRCETNVNLFVRVIA